MNYVINGDTVSQEVYEREAEDNFNADISFTQKQDGDTLTMGYEEEK